MPKATSIHHLQGKIAESSRSFQSSLVARRQPGALGDVSYLERPKWSKFLAGGTSRSRGNLNSLVPRESSFEIRSTFQEAVVEVDREMPVENSNLRPWSMICDLEIIDGNGRGYHGTGWLAGPRTVITAGHHIHHRRKGGWAKKIRVIPGRQAKTKPFGQQTSSHFSVSQNWLQKEVAPSNYAAIHLPKEFETHPGNFSFASLTDEALNQQMINISGYPKSQGARRIWTCRDQVLRARDEFIEYDSEVSGGQEGAPIFVFPNGSLQDPVVVGMHTAASTGRYGPNSAPRLTPKMFQHLQDWLRISEAD